MKKRKPKGENMKDQPVTGPQTIPFFLYHPFTLTHGGTYQPSYVPGEILPWLQHSLARRYAGCSLPCPFSGTPLSYTPVYSPQRVRTTEAMESPRKPGKRSRGFKYAQASPNPFSRVIRGNLGRETEASQLPMSLQCPQGTTGSPRVMGQAEG